MLYILVTSCIKMNGRLGILLRSFVTIVELISFFRGGAGTCSRWRSMADTNKERRFLSLLKRPTDTGAVAMTAVRAVAIRVEVAHTYELSKPSVGRLALSCRLPA
jgi:hypothetical protein